MSPQTWRPSGVARLANGFTLYSVTVNCADGPTTYPHATLKGSTGPRGRTVRIDTETAIETFGSYHVAAAVRAAGRRARRPTRTKLQEHRDEDTEVVLAQLDSDDTLEVSADSPRGPLPPGTGRHLRRIRMRSGGTENTGPVVVEIDPEQPMYPTVLAGGQAVDVAPPGLAAKALRAAANSGGRRPPALGPATLLDIATALDEQNGAVLTYRTRTATDTGSWQDANEEDLLERMLCSAWPTLTPGDGTSIWRIELGSDPPDPPPDTTRPVYLHAVTGKIHLQPEWTPSPAPEQRRIETLMRKLLTTAGGHHTPIWTHADTPWVDAVGI